MIFSRSKWRLGDLIVGFLSSYAVVWIFVSLLFVFGGSFWSQVPGRAQQQQRNSSATVEKLTEAARPSTSFPVILPPKPPHPSDHEAAAASSSSLRAKNAPLSFTPSSSISISSSSSSSFHNSGPKSTTHIDTERMVARPLPTPSADVSIFGKKQTALEVHERIAYYKRPSLTSNISAAFPRHPGKYITAEIDFGGFNNVRMSFEAVVSAAVVTGRTLVLPPKCPWYLINWGPIKREESKHALGGKSEIGDFFDVEDLSRVLPTITAEEFVRRHRTGGGDEGAGLEISESEVSMKSVQEGGSCQSELAMLMRKKASGGERGGQNGGPPLIALADQTLNPLQSVIRWIGESKQGRKPPGHLWMAGRKEVYLTKDMIESQVLHFPMDHTKDRRFLGQNAAWWWHENADAEEVMFMALRDGFHYRDEVFEAGAKVVAFLGLEGYAAMQVRRNDLQYKDSFTSASNSHAAIDNLIDTSEPIYIATDETKSGFFDDFEKHGHKTYRYQDFFTDKGGKVLVGVPAAMDPKLVGLIEQVICACGRVFVGTEMSTFTGYIWRLRGHIGVKNLNRYYHTKGPYRRGSKGEPRSESGSCYTCEFPIMWEMKAGERP